MKLKLDENLGLRGRDLLKAAGHDVSRCLSRSCAVPQTRKWRGAVRRNLVALERLLQTLIGALQSQPLDGHLWIVEEGRVRVFEPS